jgi:hypothetical protein
MKPRPPAGDSSHSESIDSAVSELLGGEEVLGPSISSNLDLALAHGKDGRYRRGESRSLTSTVR